VDCAESEGMEKAVPDCFWQCRQWHTPMRTGWAALS